MSHVSVSIIKDSQGRNLRQDLKQRHTGALLTSLILVTFLRELSYTTKNQPYVHG